MNPLWSVRIGRSTSAARKLFRLSPGERRLLVAAALLMVAIKLGLAVLPYRQLRGLVDRVARVPPRRRPAPASSPVRIAWAVERASYCVPRTTCLTQALAAKVLLERRGHSTVVRVGIAQTDCALPVAHAWVESDGHVVLGGSDLRRYTPVLLERKRSQ